jgi:hypothetical protein
MRTSSALGAEAPVLQGRRKAADGMRDNGVVDLPTGMTAEDALELRDFPWAHVDLELNHTRRGHIVGEGKYRPHFTFGETDEDRFGVFLWLYSDKLEPGQVGHAFVIFIYQKGQPLPRLCKPKAYFEVREGHTIVGHGRILESGSGGASWPLFD